MELKDKFSFWCYFINDSSKTWLNNKPFLCSTDKNGNHLDRSQTVLFTWQIWNITKKNGFKLQWKIGNVLWLLHNELYVCIIGS